MIADSILLTLPFPLSNGARDSLNLESSASSGCLARLMGAEKWRRGQGPPIFRGHSFSFQGLQHRLQSRQRLAHHAAGKALHATAESGGVRTIQPDVKHLPAGTSHREAPGRAKQRHFAQPPHQRRLLMNALGFIL